MEILASVLICSVLFWFIFVRRYGRGPKSFVNRKKDCYDDKSYTKKNIPIKPARGFLLKIAIKLTSSFFGHFWLVKFLDERAEFFSFRSTHFEEMPTFYPTAYMQPKHDQKIPPFNDQDIEKLISNNQTSKTFKFVSIGEIVSLYKDGSLTPNEMAERSLNALKQLKKYNIVIDFDAESVKEMAKASTERYKNKSTLSPIDGILVIVKDEYPAKGLTCSSGTTFLSHNSCKEDCSVVAKLRKLGAVIFAVANMHEFGLGTNGNNTNKGYGRCHNPYSEKHFTGGSSSGSAAAVSCGLVSVALGSDGGGSVRIPASYCGVFGLKPTYGRISAGGMHGHANTVSHCGPICGNVRDTAAIFSLLAGADPKYPQGSTQPPVLLPTFADDLTGLKIGIDRRYFEHCKPDVLESCNRAFQHLKHSGAEIVEFEIAELDQCIIGHRIAILSEMTTSGNKYYNNHYEQWTLPNRLLFNMAQHITAFDYIQANKQRTRNISIMKEVFSQVDVFVTPTAAHAAPEIHPGDLKYGAANGNQDTMNMRFSGLGNFTGIPGLSIPVGYNQSGLPIGLQIMSSWWREDLIFQVAEYVERKITLKPPPLTINMLSK